jgi:hypothetical protein
MFLKSKDIQSHSHLKMRWLNSLITLSLLTSLALAFPAKQEHFEAETSLRKSHKHRPHEKGGIAWDKNSLIIDGERIVLWQASLELFCCSLPDYADCGRIPSDWVTQERRIPS